MKAEEELLTAADGASSRSESYTLCRISRCDLLFFLEIVRLRTGPHDNKTKTKFPSDNQHWKGSVVRLLRPSWKSSFQCNRGETNT